MSSPVSPRLPFWKRHWLPLGVTGGLLLVTLVAGYSVVSRWDQLLESRLRPWAEAEVARLSDSTYRLTVGHVDFTAFPGRIAFDSIHVSTDSSRNLIRRRPLAQVTMHAYECALSGIDTWRLLRRKGLHANSFKCARIDVAARLPALARDSQAPAPAQGGGFLAPKAAVNLPAVMPVLAIARAQLPQVSLDVRRAHGHVDERVRVGRLFVDVRGTRIVSGEGAGNRTLYSDLVEVGGQGLLVETGSLDEIALGGLRVNLTDSTVTAQALRIGPRVSDAEWTRQQRVRKDRIRFNLDSAVMSGVDFVSLTGPHGTIGLRHVALHGLGLDVLTDLRLPPGPRSSNRSPQELVRGMGRPLAIDSITVSGGQILYHEHAVGKPVAGTASFTGLHATITNFRTVASPGAVVPPLVIDASALLFGAGRLQAVITVPLTAHDFAMNYRGSLGPMPFNTLNTFIARNMPAEIKAGQVTAAQFSAHARNGHAVGTITPEYHGLQVELIDAKASGIKRLGLELLSAAANAVKVRQSNPPGPGKPAKAGTIDHTWKRSESLIQFLWFALRDAMIPVFSK